MVFTNDNYATCEIVKFEPMVAVTVYVRLYEKYDDYNKYICGYGGKESFLKDFVFVMENNVVKNLFDYIHKDKSKNGILKSDLTVAFNYANPYPADKSSAVNNAWEAIKVDEFARVDYERFVDKYEANDFTIITDVANYSYYTKWSIDHSNLYEFIVSQLNKFTLDDDSKPYSALSLNYIRIIDDERQPTLFPYDTQIEKLKKYDASTYEVDNSIGTNFSPYQTALNKSIKDLNDSIISFYEANDKLDKDPLNPSNNTDYDNAAINVNSYAALVKTDSINMYKYIFNRIKEITYTIKYTTLKNLLNQFHTYYNAYLITHVIPETDKLSGLCSGAFCNNTLLACCERECAALDKQCTDFTLIGELCDNIESYNDVMMNLAKPTETYYDEINKISVPIMVIPNLDDVDYIAKVEEFIDYARKLYAVSVDFNANDKLCVSNQQLLTGLMGDMYDGTIITPDRIILKTDLNTLFSYAKPPISTEDQAKINAKFGADKKLTYNEFIQLVLSIQ